MGVVSGRLNLATTIVAVVGLLLAHDLLMAIAPAAGGGSPNRATHHTLPASSHHDHDHDHNGHDRPGHPPSCSAVMAVMGRVVPAPDGPPCGLAAWATAWPQPTPLSIAAPSPPSQPTRARRALLQVWRV